MTDWQGKRTNHSDVETRPYFDYNNNRLLNQYLTIFLGIGQHLKTEEELITELESMQTPQEIGRLQGEYSRGLDKCKTRMHQIKIANLRA